MTMSWPVSGSPELTMLALTLVLAFVSLFPAAPGPATPRRRRPTW
jgi:hypothetical protein